MLYIGTNSYEGWQESCNYKVYNMEAICSAYLLFTRGKSKYKWQWLAYHCNVLYAIKINNDGLYTSDSIRLNQKK